MAYDSLTALLLEKLQIEVPPVALAWVMERPASVPQTGKEAPSFCSFWRWGEQEVFYASAEQSLGCPLGGMVAGFPLGAEREREARELMADFCEAEGEAPLDDVGLRREIEQTARVDRKAAGLVAGPLWEMPIPPDVVLVWGTIIQAAVLQEVSGPLMWKNNPQGAVFTRPSCSVLPIAMLHGKTAMSLGCIGMRTYTKMPAHLYLLAVPAAHLEQLELDLQKIEDPAGRMAFYQEKLSAGTAQAQA